MRLNLTLDPSTGSPVDLSVVVEPASTVVAVRIVGESDAGLELPVPLGTVHIGRPPSPGAVRPDRPMFGPDGPPGTAATDFWDDRVVKRTEIPSSPSTLEKWKAMVNLSSVRSPSLQRRAEPLVRPVRDLVHRLRGSSFSGSAR